MSRRVLVPRVLGSAISLWLAAWTQEARAGGPVSFRRGDANLDGLITLADASYLMDAFYFDGPAPRCRDAADVDDDGALGQKDAVYLLNWLYFRTPSPPALPPPFQAGGKDPTTDALDCADDAITPPGLPDPTLEIALAVPPDLARGEKAVEIFLRATASEAPDGFSAAYLVDKAAIEVVRLDLMGTDFPQDRRLDFEASEFFRTAVVPGPDAHHDVVLAGALFIELVGGKPERIVFPPLLRQAGEGVGLLRLLINVKDDAPLGDRELLIPTGPPPDLAGAVTELIARGSSRRPGSSPPGRTYIVRDPGKIFMRRADANGDAVVDISDPIRTLNHLFSGAPPPPCEDAADVNDDGLVNIADPVFALTFLFDEGLSPSLPFPDCGRDPTFDTLSCFADC